MSWGNKLVVVFLVFAALMATLVFKAVNTKFELVSKDYYKDELRYQEKLDGAVNAVAAGAIKLMQDEHTIKLQLPEVLSTTIVEGDAWFYCKTKASKDQRFSIKIENGVYSFNKSTFEHGSYELKLPLTAGGKQYYYSTFIIIQ